MHVFEMKRIASIHELPRGWLLVGWASGVQGLDTLLKRLTPIEGELPLHNNGNPVSEKTSYRQYGEERQGYPKAVCTSEAGPRGVRSMCI
jgi:hypothetical protein